MQCPGSKSSVVKHSALTFQGLVLWPHSCAKQIELDFISHEPIKAYSFGEENATAANKEKVEIKLRNSLNHKKQIFPLEVNLTNFITNAEILVSNKIE